MIFESFVDPLKEILDILNVLSSSSYWISSSASWKSDLYSQASKSIYKVINKPMYYSQHSYCTFSHSKPYLNKRFSLSIAKGFINITLWYFQIPAEVVSVKKATAHRNDDICFDSGLFVKTHRHFTCEKSGKVVKHPHSHVENRGLWALAICVQRQTTCGFCI